ncbi:MAG: hypothetical protein D8M59_03110 [Planctomycetes bacterium]|nr:hypothetical protein [Planctomycetota bacterium]NOG52984.1 hypothetical protein [Planctomycetota bacterium]
MDEQYETNQSDGQEHTPEPELQQLDDSVRALLRSDRVPDDVLDRVYLASVEHLPADSTRHTAASPLYSFVRQYGAIAAAIVVVAAVGLAVVADRTGIFRWLPSADQTLVDDDQLTATADNTDQPPITDDGAIDTDSDQDLQLASNEMYGDDSILLEASRIKARLASATKSLSSSAWSGGGADTYMMNSTARQAQDTAYWLDTDLDSF